MNPKFVQIREYRDNFIMKDGGKGMDFYSLSQDEVSVILGGLLGDSCYKRRDNVIVFSHSAKQKEYLSWKHDILSDISSDIRTRVVGKSIIADEELVNVSFSTKTNKKYHADYNSIRTLIFSNGKKTVNRKWLNMLTPLSLAVWWMDDGCLSVHKKKDGAISRFGKLSTNGFSYEEQKIMKDYFKTVWDIDVKITPEKGNYFLRFTVPNLKKLFLIIYPFVMQVPDMIYKINMKYKLEKLSDDDEYKVIQTIIYDTLDNKKS